MYTPRISIRILAFVFFISVFLILYIGAVFPQAAYALERANIDSADLIFLPLVLNDHDPTPPPPPPSPTPPPTEPLFETVYYNAQEAGSAMVQDNPSLELGEGEFEDFTIEMFFYVSDLSYDGGPAVDGLARKKDSYSMYIDFHDTQPDLIMFEITLMTVPFDIVYQLTVETDILVGWHHIAFVFDNEYSVDEDAATIYLDGNRIAHSPDPGNDSFDMPQIMSNSWPLTFGGNFNGYIEEIRLSEIVRYGTTTYSVPTIPFSTDGHTRALWHFNETPGSTTFNDASSYSNHLTGLDGAQTYKP